VKSRPAASAARAAAIAGEHGGQPGQQTARVERRRIPAYGPEIDPDNPHEFHYEMSREQAEAWRAARTAAERP
jgi:hypothetical protein